MAKYRIRIKATQVLNFAVDLNLSLEELQEDLCNRVIDWQRFEKYASIDIEESVHTDKTEGLEETTLDYYLPEE